MMGYLLTTEEQEFYLHQEHAYGAFGAEMMYLYNPRRWQAEMDEWLDAK